MDGSLQMRATFANQEKLEGRLSEVSPQNHKNV